MLFSQLDFIIFSFVILEFTSHIFYIETLFTRLPTYGMLLLDPSDYNGIGYMIFILFIVLNRYIKNAKNTKLNASNILIITNPIVNPAYFYELFDIPNVYVTFCFIY